MRVAALLTIGFCLPTFWAYGENGPEFDDVRSYIVDAVDEGRVPSVAVAVLHEDKVLWCEAFGMADVAAQRPATPDTPYWLASISKPITATALMTLAEAGKVDLDAPANQYLHGQMLRAYVGGAEAMTVRTLLTHTSGLPTHWNFFYDGVAPYTIDEAIQRHGFAAAEPGSRYNYSNLGYGVLSQISANVSGVTWARFLQDALFEPAGMTNTSDWAPETAPDTYARPYTRDSRGQFSPVGLYRFDHPGASTVWSSALDMVQFARLHLNEGNIDGKQLLRKDTALAMRTLAKGSDGEAVAGGYALGWSVGSYRNVASFAHNGGMPGVSTAMTAFPDSKSAIVVLTNCSNPALAGAVETRIKRALFPDAKLDRKTQSEDETEDPDPPDLSGEWIGHLAHHEGDVPMQLSVDVEGGVRVRLGESLEQSLDNVALRNGVQGGFSGLIDHYRHFHGQTALTLDLRREENRLEGILYATADSYFRVPYWVSLERQ
jgi:CubicO group peptidase (beta-lactamase class C family)